MAINIFSLVGSIMVDSDEANRSIQKTNKNAKGLGDTLGNGIKTAGKWAAGIATATAAAATAAGAALKSAVDDTAAYADEIDKASLRSGLGAENLQRLKYAAEQSGASLGNLESTAKKFNAQLAEIAQGSEAGETAAEAFESLGVALYDSAGNLRSTDELYNEVLLKLADMPDSAERTAIATDIMGKGFTDLKPLLDAGSEGITDLMNNADKLGIVMGEDAVKAGVEYGDTIADIKNALSGAARSIGQTVLPMFQRLADKIIDYIPKIQDFVAKLTPPVEQLADVIVTVMESMVDDILPPLLDLAQALIKPVGDLIQKMLPPMVKLLNKLTPIIVEVVDKLLPPLVEIMAAFTPILDIVLELLDPILDLVKAMITPLGAILTAVAPIITALVELIDKGLTPVKDKFGETAESLDKTVMPALQLVSDLLSLTVLPIFQSFVEFLDGDWAAGLQSASGGIINAFQSAFDFVDTLLGTKLGEWYGKVTDFFQGFGSYIYQITNGDKIDEVALHGKYSDVAQQVRLEANNNIRAGMSADEALTAAKSKYLKTSEALYYWDAYGNYDAEDAARRIAETQRREDEYNRVHQTSADYYYAAGRDKLGLPHLARGGMVYGDTLAVVGDNADARSNPEVVAPLDELSRIIAEAMGQVADRIIAAIPQGRQLNAYIDGEQLITFAIDGINDRTRQDGYCPIKI